jgi:hypothetical protein
VHSSTLHPPGPGLGGGVIAAARPACAWLVGLVLVAQGCARGEPCLTQDDCLIGTYCERTNTQGFDEGVCISDCLAPSDCPVTDPALQVGVCDNTGRCRVGERPPRLRVLDPENDTLLAEDTREIRLVGEVESAAAEVRVEIEPSNNGACVGGETVTLTLSNDRPGTLAKMSFVTPSMPVDPGLTSFVVRGTVGAGSDILEHLVELPCPGCASVALELPRPRTSLSVLELPRLEGSISPASVSDVLWRVRSDAGEVIDGTAGVVGGRFVVTRVPLFAGKNRVQVVVTGVGSGLGESRCSTSVVAGSGRELGLRALMTWDGPTSDLDLHLITAGGRFGDPLSDLSARGGRALLGGEVVDDFDGRGPERVSAPSLPDGVYGVVVEPVFDAEDAGANTFLRVLWNGRLVVPGPIGPAFLSTFDGRLWIAGVLRISGGESEWEPLDDYLPVSMPPTRSPSEWPSYY